VFPSVGRTHLAYKAEHVVDLKSDLVVAADIRPADHPDTQTIVDSVILARANLQVAGSTAEFQEVAADKGYHAAGTLELAEALGLRTYIPEPSLKHHRRWTDKPAAFAALVYSVTTAIIWLTTHTCCAGSRLMAVPARTDAAFAPRFGRGKKARVQRAAKRSMTS
jgi:hypothetical protein